MCLDTAYAHLNLHHEVVDESRLYDWDSGYTSDGTPRNIQYNIDHTSHHSSGVPWHPFAPYQGTNHVQSHNTFHQDHSPVLCQDPISAVPLLRGGGDEFPLAESRGPLGVPDNVYSSSGDEYMGQVSVTELV